MRPRPGAGSVRIYKSYRCLRRAESPPPKDDYPIPRRLRGYPPPTEEFQARGLTSGSRRKREEKAALSKIRTREHSGTDDDDDHELTPPPPRRTKKPRKSKSRGGGGKFENFRVTIHNESDGTPSLSGVEDDYDEGTDGGGSDVTRESPVEKSRRSTPPPPPQRLGWVSPFLQHIARQTSTLNILTLFLKFHSI